MEAKRKLWVKVISVFLAMLFVMEVLPLSVMAQEKQQYDSLKISTSEDVVADIDCEIESERDKYSKTYLLEDGSYASVISAVPIHQKSDDGIWEEIVDIDEPTTVSDVQSEISTLAEITNENADTSEDEEEPEYTNTYQSSDLEARTIGTYINSIEANELRIQRYTVSTTSKALSYGYIKIPNLNLLSSGDRCIITKATVNAKCHALSSSKNNIVLAQTVTTEWPSNNVSKHPVESKVMDYNIIGSNEKVYEWDITEAACRWSSGTLENNGIALSPKDNNCRISAYLNSVVLCYKIIDELDNNYSYHSVEMGRAGTAYINDFTNDFYLVRDELSIDGNIMPVSLQRTFNSAQKDKVNSSGDGWHWNYVSSLIEVESLNKYKWTTEHNKIIYFEATDDYSIWKSQDKEYTLTLGDEYDTITSNNEEYKYDYDKTEHKLSQIRDENNSTIKFNYDDALGMSIVTDGVNRSFILGSTTIDNSENYVGTLTAGTVKYTTEIDDEGDEYTVIESTPFKINDISMDLKYHYSKDSNEKIRLSKVDYPDSKSVTYEYNDDGTMKSVTNVDGTKLNIEYDESGKVTSYTKKLNDTILDSCTIDNTEAYQRIFTEYDGSVTRQQYDIHINLISEMVGIDGHFYEYDENDNIKSVTNTEEHESLLENGNFEDATANWELSENSTIINDSDLGNKDSAYGSHALSITGTYDDIEYAYQICNVPEQTKEKQNIFTVGAWAKVDGSKAKDNRTVSLIVQEYCDGTENEGEGNTVLASITYDNSITDWQYLMVSFEIPENVKQVQVVLSYNYQIGSVGFDGVTFYKSTMSTVSNVVTEEYGCICSDCTDSNCNCKCTDETDCKHSSCKKGTTITEKNNYGLTLSEETTDSNETMLNSYSYSDSGNYLVSATDENGTVTYYNYDENTGLLTSMSIGDESNTVNYSYNAVGLLNTVSQTVTNIFDNSTVEMSSEYSYDGDTLSSITHNGMTYSFEYDDYGNTTKVSLNNSSLKTTSYVNSGQNIGNIIYANGDAIVYEYDDYGNISKVYSADADDNGDFQNQTLKYEYSYDNGELKSIKDYVNSTITKYTDDGYTVSTVSTDDDGNTVDTLIYSCFSNDSAESYSFNVSDTKNYKVTYTDNKNQYDADYGITTNSSSVILSTDTTDDDGNTSTDTDTYSAESITDYFGRTVSNTFGKDNNQISTTYTYKTNGSYTTNLVESSTTKIGTEEYKYEYEYDNAGRLIKKSLNGELVAQYSYDEAGQLIEEVNDPIDCDTKISYDNGGNINGFYQSSFTNEDDQYSYLYVNNNDQLTTFDEDEIIYDENGNITDDGWRNTFTWSDNQLIKAHYSSNYYCAYKYNEDGMLASKKNYYVTASGKATEKDAISYFWNGNKLIGEKFVSKLEKSIYRNGKYYGITKASLNITILYDSNDNPIGFNATGTKASKNVNETYYYIKDVTGQINSIVRASDNANVCNIYYDAWGLIYDYEGIDPIAFYASPFLYKDYIYDMDMKLYYCQSRYYNPYIQRFISMDSLYDTYSGTPLANNTYIYCENDPVNNVDPLGYFKIRRWMIAFPIDAVLLSTPAGALFAPIKAAGKQFGKAVVEHGFSSHIFKVLNWICKNILGIAQKIVNAIKSVKVINGLKFIKNLSAKKITASILGFALFKTPTYKLLGLLIKNVDIVLSIGGFFSGLLDLAIDGNVNDVIWNI